MNKGELIEAIAKVTETKVEAAKVLETTLTAITKSLKKGDPVTLIGFGTFKVVLRAPRKARNPQTGEPIDVPAKMVAKFKPSKAMKELILTYEAPEAEEATE